MPRFQPISVRMARWEQHLVVQFQEDSKILLERAGLTQGASFVYESPTLNSGGTLHYLADEDGLLLTPVRILEAGDFCWQFDSASWSNFLDIELARFGRSEFLATLEDGLLSVKLPPPHLLPWFRPSERPGEEGATIQEICTREFTRRLRSALHAGEKRIHVPSLVRHHLPPDFWRAELARLQRELARLQRELAP